MAKTITVTINEKGETKIEASGFTGTDCLAATKSLEEALGVSGERTTKSEALVTQSNTTAWTGQK